MSPALPHHRVTRVLEVRRRGSSLPVIAETSGGRFVVKLRGAAQGVLPLIAEIVVGELATALGLSVPERALVEVPEGVPSLDRNDELRDLLDRSVGLGLGIRFLDAATELRLDQVSRVDPEARLTCLWLDGFAQNLDRTPSNPNVLFLHGQPWFIDHGSALHFHFDLAHLTEDSPREPSFDPSAHLFALDAPRLASVDARLASSISRAVLEAALARVPDDFLVTARPDLSPDRLRALYVAFLWKRLKAPRSF